MRALLAALLLSFSAQAQEVVLLVRHAEKLDTSKDTRLSPGGEARAQALATKLRDAGITAIWTTELHRTQDTAKPLADALHLTMKMHPADDSKGLVALLRKEGGRPLIVGHSNTLPEIAKLLGASLADLRDDEFDGLFLVVGKKVVTLRQ